MLTECSQDSFDFASFGKRKVTAAFDGGALTSNAGALLLREADRGIGLSRQVAACFKDGRRQDKIEHAVETLLPQRIHGIALVYEDLNDHDELRHDPVLGLVSGKLEARRPDCAVPFRSGAGSPVRQAWSSALPGHARSGRPLWHRQEAP